MGASFKATEKLKKSGENIINVDYKYNPVTKVIYISAQ